MTEHRPKTGPRNSNRSPNYRTTRIAKPAAAKEQLIVYVEAGQTIAAGLEKIGRSRKTYELWRREDPDFKSRIDAARARQAAASDRKEKGQWMPFAEWRQKYLGVPTYWHQMQWIDVLEGRQPRDLHPAQQFTQGKRGRLLINVPPNHAKSTTLTTDYVVYKLCMDPAYRVAIISAGDALAKAFLYAIKQRLTSPDYLQLQLDYGPDGGFEQSSEEWTQSQIVFSTAHRNTSPRGNHEKDPNVQALGLRSKVYGRRIDLAIVDDAVDTSNAGEYQKQMVWLTQEIETRFEGGGKLLVVGTRMAPIDLYAELMKPENYADGKSPWTHFAAPAILEGGEDPREWVTLWPEATIPWVRREDFEQGDECLCEQTDECSRGREVDGETVYPRWDGLHLARGPKASLSAARWALVYQQASIPEDATFPEKYVAKATNAERICGRLQPNIKGHPILGQKGMYVIAGLDPSVKGFAGMVVAAIDRETQKCYILNAWNLRAPTKDQLVAKMQEVTEHYTVNEWRVEKNGLLQFFTQDSVLRSWMAVRGVRFTDHQTGTNKWDSAFGISSIASMFGEYEHNTGKWAAEDWNLRTIVEPLIELPRPNKDGIKALVHQLVTWTPDNDPKRVPQDMIMALWFLVVGYREHLGYGRGSSPITAFTRNSRFVTGSRKTTVVNLRDFRAS